MGSPLYLLGGWCTSSSSSSSGVRDPSDDSSSSGVRDPSDTSSSHFFDGPSRADLEASSSETLRRDLEEEREAIDEAVECWTAAAVMFAAALTSGEQIDAPVRRLPADLMALVLSMAAEPVYEAGLVDEIAASIFRKMLAKAQAMRGLRAGRLKRIGPDCGPGASCAPKKAATERALASFAVDT